MTAQELAARGYTECAVTDQTTTGKRCYMAYSPEVVHCLGQGWTSEEAIADLRLARIDLFQSLLDDGLPVPEPKRWGNVIYIDGAAHWEYLRGVTTGTI